MVKRAVQSESKNKSMEERLLDQVRLWDREHRKLRATRRTFLQDFVGPYYRSDISGHKAGRTRLPVNKVNHIITTFLPYFSSANPRARVIPKVVPHDADRDEIAARRVTASRLGAAVDQEFKRLHWFKVKRTVLIDAFVSFGIVKVGLGPGGQTQGDSLVDDNGNPLQNGVVYVSRVSPDDFVLDPHCKTLESAQFMGNRYELPLDYLEAHPELFEPDVVSELKTVSLVARHEGKWAGKYKKPQDALRPVVPLVDIWVRQDGKVYTVPEIGHGPAKSLRVAEYDHPDGPYEVLGFEQVPDSPIPLCPVAVWYDLSVLINKNMQKAGRQAESYRRFVAYDDSTDERYISNAQNADDAWVPFPNIDRIRQMEVGGASEKLYEYAAFASGQLSEISGNTEILSGSGPQSGTATQDEILAANAGRRVDDMDKAVYDFDARVAERIATYLWDDNIGETPIRVLYGDGSEEVGRFSSKLRHGDLSDYGFEIVVNSGRIETPDRRLKRKLEILERAVIPLSSFAEKQGTPPNLREIIESLSCETGMPELSRWIGPPVGDRTEFDPEAAMTGAMGQRSPEADLARMIQGGPEAPEKKVSPQRAMERM